MVGSAPDYIGVLCVPGFNPAGLTNTTLQHNEPVDSTLLCNDLNRFLTSDFFTSVPLRSFLNVLIHVHVGPTCLLACMLWKC